MEKTSITKQDVLWGERLKNPAVTALTVSANWLPSDWIYHWWVCEVILQVTRNPFWQQLHTLLTYLLVLSETLANVNQVKPLSLKFVVVTANFRMSILTNSVYASKSQHKPHKGCECMFLGDYKLVALIYKVKRDVLNVLNFRVNTVTDSLALISVKAMQSSGHFCYGL